MAAAVCATLAKNYTKCLIHVTINKSCQMLSSIFQAIHSSPQCKLNKGGLGCLSLTPGNLCGSFWFQMSNLLVRFGQQFVILHIKSTK